ncbi:TetR/AcrR family transcriptional regulator, partial [Mycobacteroides abscessus]|uniref:TetR/AcrR family transcriptional regulator n=1 Tax=Mycobacteroides abscessus TaxID=36809 RepID=UPI0010498B4C
MPRPGNPDIRRRLLASGLELFYARGVNATGVKEIADRAHVPKAAFYTYYESKEAFVVAVLERLSPLGWWEFGDGAEVGGDVQAVSVP